MDNSVLCVIVSYNPDDTINKCISSVCGQVNEILVVDNGSTVKPDILKETCRDTKINVIYNDKNMGIAYALNQGAKYALKNNFKWILTMDQDSEAAPDMINIMLDSYNKFNANERHKIAGIFPSYAEKALMKGRKDLKNNNFVVRKLDTDTNVENTYYVLSEITSGNLLRCDIFNEVGFYEDKLFIDFVDHEFCLRINKYGFKLIKAENAYLLHQLGNSIKKKLLFKKVKITNHSYIRRYYITRNRLYVWKKYFKQYPSFVFSDIDIAVKEFILIIIFESDRILKLKMILKGIMDFILNKYGEIKFKKHIKMRR